MDLYLNENKQEELLKNQEKIEDLKLKTGFQEEPEFQEGKKEQKRSILAEREEKLYANLSETCQSFIPDHKTNELVPPQRYQTPSKGKKGRTKRKEDEARLSNLRKEKNIAAVVNHRGMRVVEKWNGNYNPAQPIEEPKVLEMKKATDFCLNLVPSTAMAEEKYLADHAEDVKEMFRQTIYLERAMENPENQDFFKGMSDLEKSILDANMTAMKGLRKLMKAKLLTMGVLLNDEDYENITTDYLTEEQASTEALQKANEDLQTAQNAYITANIKLNIKSSQAKKELEAIRGGDYPKYEKIANRQIDGPVFTEYKEKIHKAMEEKNGGRFLGNTRFAVVTAARMSLATGMDFNEAVQMGIDLQLYAKVGALKVTMTQEERKRFTTAMEKVYSYLNSLDKELSNRLAGKDAFFDCSQEEYESFRTPQLISFDLNDLTSAYGKVLAMNPEDCGFSEEKFIESRALKDSLQVLHGISGHMESLYGTKEFYEKNVSLTDMKAISQEEIYEKAQAFFKGIPYEVQKANGINFTVIGMLSTQLNTVNVDDFDSIYKEDLKNVKSKYAEEKKPYTLHLRSGEIGNYDKKDTQKRKDYRDEVSNAIKEKTGDKELSGNWRFAVSTASSFGYAGGLSPEEVTQLGISLGLKGKSIKTASPEELKEYAKAVEKVLDYLDSVDLSLMNKAGTLEQLDLSEEEHTKLRSIVALSMDMDHLMGDYEVLLYQHPEYCTRNDESYKKSLAQRDLFTTMNQQVMLLDRAYGNDYFAKNVPFYKFETMSTDDVTEEMNKVPMQAKPEEVAGLLGLFGDVLYMRAGIQEEKFVPGNIKKNVAIATKEANENFAKRRKNLENHGNIT